MGKEEKAIAKKIAEAAKVLSPAKREYLIGFAEGVAAVNESKKEDADAQAKAYLDEKHRQEGDGE